MLGTKYLRIKEKDMINEVKPNYSGIKFTETAILLRYENMSKNKTRDTDPDYYKVVLDVDGEILETSAWIGCEIEKLQKNVADVLYKPYKVTFGAVKGNAITRTGSTIEFYKIKVIGIQNIKDNEIFK